MAIAPVNSASAGSANVAVTSLDCARPSGAGDGHVAIAAIEVNNASGDTTTSTGWTQLENVYHGTTGQVTILYKVLGASEPASYTFTLSDPAAGIAIVITAFSGVDTTDISDTSATTTSAGSQDQNTAPSVTPTVIDRYLVCAWGSQGNVSHTVPGSMSEQVDVTSTVGTFRAAALATEQLSGSSATGTRIATTSAIMGANGGAAASFLLNPAPSGWSTRTAPDAILGKKGLSGALTDIDDDPDSADGNWLVVG